MGRPPKHPVETKLKIVLSVLASEASQAEAARQHGVSETSIGRISRNPQAASAPQLKRANLSQILDAGQIPATRGVRLADTVRR